MATTTVTGAQLAWASETAPAPSAVLAHHLPNVPNLGDLTTLDWATVPPVDILTAGYPCQPFSEAGPRKGTDDDRHLWPYIRAAIRHLQPRLTFLENVPGHRSLGFDQVLADMAQDGLYAAWCSVRASDVGAPHHRDRLFIIATPADASSVGQEAGEVNTGGYASEGAFFDVGGFTFPDQLPGEPWQYGEYWPVVERWAGVMGRPAPVPTLADRYGRVLNPRFEEWAMGLPEGWVTDVPGVDRLQAYHLLGNGVVPQQAGLALRTLLGGFTE